MGTLEDGDGKAPPRPPSNTRSDCEPGESEESSSLAFSTRDNIDNPLLSPATATASASLSLLLMSRAATRVSRLLELLGLVGDEAAWARRVSGDSHVVGTRLLEYAAMGYRYLEYVTAQPTALPVGDKDELDSSTNDDSSPVPSRSVGHNWRGGEVKRWHRDTQRIP